MICDIVEPLTKGKGRGRVFHVKVENSRFDSLPELKKILTAYKGSDPVIIHMDGRTIKVGEEHYVSIDPAIVTTVEELLGKDSAWVDGR